MAGNRDTALALYEQYITTPWPDRLTQDYAHLPGAYLRLGELHAEQGDGEKAIEYYTLFVELWAESDRELQPRVESARAALAQLQGGMN